MKSRFFLVALALALAGCAHGPAPQPRPSAPAPGVPIPPAPPKGEPSDYLNLSGAQLRAIFGAPQFVRQDGATQMWRYDGASCRVFFFLYGNRGAEAVRHVETLPAGTVSAADPVCLTAVRAAKPTS